MIDLTTIAVDPDPEKHVSEIKRIRDTYEVGVETAKRVVRRAHILRSIDDCRDFYHLRALVRTIAETVL